MGRVGGVRGVIGGVHRVHTVNRRFNSVIPHSRRIYYVRQVAIIVDNTLKSRGIIFIIRIWMKL